MISEFLHRATKKQVMPNDLITKYGIWNKYDLPLSKVNKIIKTVKIIKFMKISGQLTPAYDANEIHKIMEGIGHALRKN